MLKKAILLIMAVVLFCMCLTATVSAEEETEQNWPDTIEQNWPDVIDQNWPDSTDQNWPDAEATAYDGGEPPPANEGGGCEG